MYTHLYLAGFAQQDIFKDLNMVYRCHIFFFLLPLTSIPDYEQASLSPAVFSLEFCPADFLAVSLKSSG